MSSIFFSLEDLVDNNSFKFGDDSGALNSGEIPLELEKQFEVENIVDNINCLYFYIFNIDKLVYKNKNIKQSFYKNNNEFIEFVENKQLEKLLNEVKQLFQTTVENCLKVKINNKKLINKLANSLLKSFTIENCKKQSFLQEVKNTGDLIYELLISIKSSENMPSYEEAGELARKNNKVNSRKDFKQYLENNINNKEVVKKMWELHKENKIVLQYFYNNFYKIKDVELFKNKSLKKFNYKTSKENFDKCKNKTYLLNSSDCCERIVYKQTGKIFSKRVSFKKEVVEKVDKVKEKRKVLQEFYTNIEKYKVNTEEVLVATTRGFIYSADIAPQIEEEIAKCKVRLKEVENSKDVVKTLYFDPNKIVEETDKYIKYGIYIENRKNKVFNNELVYENEHPDIYNKDTQDFLYKEEDENVWNIYYQEYIDKELSNNINKENEVKDLQIEKDCLLNKINSLQTTIENNIKFYNEKIKLGWKVDCLLQDNEKYKQQIKELEFEVKEVDKEIFNIENEVEKEVNIEVKEEEEEKYIVENFINKLVNINKTIVEVLINKKKEKQQTQDKVSEQNFIKKNNWYLQQYINKQ